MTSDSQMSTSDDYLVKESATLNWTLNAFTNLTGSVISRKFSAPTSKNKFQLSLKSKTDILTAEGVVISLWYNENESELSMRYRVSIVNVNGVKQYTQEYYWKYCKAVNNGFKNKNFIHLIYYEDCLRYLVNGSLILNCEVEVLENNLVATYKAAVDSSQANFIHDHQKLLENPKFSDATLFVKDRGFKVHKAILAARSVVFEAMFSNDLEEKKLNRVEIPDIEVDVFEHLLRYIYTGKIPDLDEYALDLFVATDKYQLAYLKPICEQSLCSNLSAESVVKVLVIADMHNASELKSKCIQYITSNLDKVTETEVWKQNMDSQPGLLMELLHRLSIQMKLQSTKF